MARLKNKRTLNFKPLVKSYIPEAKEYSGITHILHEEIEAIYLMDVLGLYQEDAAKKMEVSRTTFTRIIKNARQKLANGLISGHKIDIQDSKDNYIVAICCDSENLSTHISPNEKLILYFNCENDNVTLIKVVDNPVSQEDKKPAIVLPNLFVENNVNFFISSKIGEGLKNSLISKGICPIEKKQVTIKELVKLI